MKSRSVISGLVWLIVLGGLAAGAYWYWNRPGEKPPEFRTAKVTRGELTQVVTATGGLAPVLNVQVGSQISGRIGKLAADFNSRVTNGQLIAEIDAATYKANVRQAEGQLARSKAGRELARISAGRIAELLKEKLVPPTEYDKAQADLDQAEADVTIREADLERNQVDLERTSIYSPVDGVVISRNVDVGQTVAASLNAPTLFVIANDLSQMQISAMVSEADIGGVEENQSVRFTVDAYPLRTFTGKVKQIRNAPTTNQNVVTYDCVVAVDNSDLKLKPGMTANVSIILAESSDVLKIPNSALRFRPPGSNDTRRASAGGPPGEGAERMGGPGGGPGGSGGRRGGGGGGAGGPGAGRGQGIGDGGERGRAERAAMRTVYVLAGTNTVAGVAPKLDPRQIKIGISDGTATEVVEGLKEDELVVVGSTSADAPRSGGPPANPFGGGGRRF